MNRVHDLLMREACFISSLAEQALCISLLIQSGKLSKTESEIIGEILHEKLKALTETSTSLQSNIAFNTTSLDAEKSINKNSFTARLKMALVHTKTTQAALAWAINVSQGTISQIVTGKVKEAEIVRTTAIAEALGISASWLLYGEGDMHDKQPESFESQAARLAFSNAK